MPTFFKLEAKKHDAAAIFVVTTSCFFAIKNFFVYPVHGKEIEAIIITAFDIFAKKKKVGCWSFSTLSPFFDRLNISIYCFVSKRVRSVYRKGVKYTGKQVVMPSFW